MTRGEQVKALSKLATTLIVTCGTVGGTTRTLTAALGGAEATVPVLTLTAEGALVMERVAVPVGAVATAVGTGVGGVYVLSTASEGDDPSLTRSRVGTDATEGGPKAGSSKPDGAGKRFPESVKEQARAESGGKCVFCGTKTGETPGITRSEIDHAVPKARGGDNSLNNAQNTCRTCNRAKGAQLDRGVP